MKACITGASSGIGKEFAYILAKQGYDLVLVARRKQLLQQIKDDIQKRSTIKITLIVADLTTKVHQVAKQIEDVDILINNAGFGEYGAFASSKRSEELIALNITALTVLSRAVLPYMLKKGKGGIITVASVAGFMPGPFMSTYFASKAYVVSFSEALAEEVAGSGVTVSCLCPGRTETEFFSVAHTRKLGKQGHMVTASDVAWYGWKAFTRRKTIAVYGFWNGLAVQMIRFLPRIVVRKLLKRIL